MGGLRRTVHPVSQIAWGKLKQLAPDVGVQANTGIVNGDGHKQGSDLEPMALVFTDPDLEQHVYVFNEQGRVELLRQLTGGLVVPS